MLTCFLVRIMFAFKRKTNKNPQIILILTGLEPTGFNVGTLQKYGLYPRGSTGLAEALASKSDLV